MATRSLIGKIEKVNDKTRVLFAYVHYDGYPEHMSVVLPDEEQAVGTLIVNGPYKGIYLEDEEHEKLVDPLSSESGLVTFAEFMHKGKEVDYLYLFVSEKRGWVYSGGERPEWNKLPNNHRTK